MAGRVSTDPYDRFMEKVRVVGACWEWQATTLGRAPSYGGFSFGGRYVYAHRWHWEHAHGPIPSGQQINHHCDNPICVRLDHLYLGDQAQNLRDAYARGRKRYHQREKTHCPKGHEYTPENTYFHDPRSGRSCRTCKRDYMRRRRAAAKG